MMTVAIVAITLGSILVAVGGAKGGPDTPAATHKGLSALGVLLWALSWPLFFYVLVNLKPE